MSKLLDIWDELEESTGETWILEQGKLVCQGHTVAWTEEGWVYSYGHVKLQLITGEDFLSFLRHYEKSKELN